MSFKPKDILVITTGGTIDSHYDPAKGVPYHVPQTGESAVPFALKELGLDGRCYVHELCSKDSKEITRKELSDILAQMKRHQNIKKIIITHGTDTMPRNARQLEAMLARQDKQDRTVIFTGGMEPLRDDQLNIRPDADGWANLKLAVEGADSKEAGVYVAVNGKVHDAQAIDKWVKVDENDQVVASGFTERAVRSTEQVESRGRG